MELIHHGETPARAGLICLYTIGYEGRSLDEFLFVLAQYEVSVLVDVRRTPWSYKPGFRKSRLASELETKSIEYVHLPQFGSAPELRAQLKQTRDWETFAGAYTEQLVKSDESIKEALGSFQGKRICLLCVEANHEQCHRSILAGQIAELGLCSPPVHL